MKRFAMATVLGLLLSLNAMAGDIPTSGSPAPLPPATVQTDSTIPGDIQSVPGDIPISGLAEQLNSDWFTVLSAILIF